MSIVHCEYCDRDLDIPELVEAKELIREVEMKYWILAILEESFSCGGCGHVIRLGEPAFILMDTNKPAERIEWVNCLECIKVKFPDIGSIF